MGLMAVSFKLSQSYAFVSLEIVGVVLSGIQMHPTSLGYAEASRSSSSFALVTTAISSTLLLRLSPDTHASH